MRRTMGKARMIASAVFLMTMNYALIRLHGNQKVWKFFAEVDPQRISDLDSEIAGTKGGQGWLSLLRDGWGK